MRDAIIFLMGASSGGLAGWIAREFKIYIDDEMKVRRTMRDLRAQVDKEDRA